MSIENIKKEEEIRNRSELVYSDNQIKKEDREEQQQLVYPINFPSDLREDQLLDLQKQFPSKYSKQINNLYKCDTAWTVYECPKDHTKIKIPKVCDNRFCKKPGCVVHRICRIERKLNSTFKKAIVVYHFQIGSNLMELQELRKSIINKFLPTLRKKINPATHQFYRCLYVAVFDIGKKNFIKFGKYYKHYHIAFLFEKISKKHLLKTGEDLLIKINSRFIKPNFNNKPGFKPKENVFHYFAKRAAGEYGHGEDLYYLQNLMDLKEYFEKYSNRRFLTFSKGLLVYKSGKEREGFLCPFCETPMEYIGSEEKSNIGGLDPPDTQFKEQIKKISLIKEVKINFDKAVTDITTRNSSDWKKEFGHKEE